MMVYNNKVLCLIESLAPGGAERQLAYLASELKRKGYDVFVWTYYPEVFYLPILEESGVKYRYISEANDKIKRFFVLKKEIKKLNPFVVVSYLDTTCIYSCFIKAFGGNFRLVVSERNITNNLGVRERVKFFSYRYADCIVSNSESQAIYLKNHYPSLVEKVKVITNYVDTKKFHPVNNQFDDTIIRALVVARVMPQKNTYNLIKVIDILRKRNINITIDWFGTTYDNNYMMKCVELVSELQLDEFFSFKPVSNNIASVYPQYNLFCLPSLYEGFSNVICEAMCCGLPIICSDVADNSKIVQEGENALLFNPLDLDSIVGAFVKFYQMSKDEKIHFSNKSRIIADEMFSSDKFVNSYIDLLEVQS